MLLNGFVYSYQTLIILFIKYSYLTLIIPFIKYSYLTLIIIFIKYSYLTLIIIFIKYSYLTLIILFIKYSYLWRCPWCNGYRRRKWTRRHEFKSWTRIIAFHIALISLGKLWIQIFSLQLWVGQTRFSSLGEATSLEEGKLNSNLLNFA